MQMDEGGRDGRSQRASLLPVANDEKSSTKEEQQSRVPAWVYVVSWMILSFGLILLNKSIFERARFPILMTCYHLTLATIMTQVLAHASTWLDSRHVVQMTRSMYIQTIVPIGLLYSLSLACSNQTYLYLSLAFMQMLKGTAPIAVFLALCSLRLISPTLRTLLNLSVIVAGIVLASIGEIKFQMLGFLFQMGGVVFEAYRLAFTQKLLGDEKLKMDPLVSLYYFAPCCVAFNCAMGFATEWRNGIDWDALGSVGWPTLLLNGIVAMALNFASVLLIGRTSSLVLTLCGVLKSISIMAASMLFYGDVVTPVQYVGNGIALAGLVYYQLGADKVHSLLDRPMAWPGTLPTTDGGRMMILATLALCCVVFFATVVAWKIFDIGHRFED